MRLQTDRINKNSHLIKLVRKDLDANKGDVAIKKLQTNNLQLNEDTRNDKCDSAGARTLDPLIKSGKKALQNRFILVVISLFRCANCSIFEQNDTH